MTKWKVGDKVKWKDIEIILVFVGATYFVGIVDGDECSGFLHQLKTIKTPAEIERERVVDDIMLTLGLSEKCNISVVRESLSLAHDLGYIVDPSKKVKPLSMEDSIHIETSSASIGNAINRLIDGGHIILGADND